MLISKVPAASIISPSSPSMVKSTEVSGPVAMEKVEPASAMAAKSTTVPSSAAKLAEAERLVPLTVTSSTPRRATEPMLA